MRVPRYEAAAAVASPPRTDVSHPARCEPRYPTPELVRLRAAAARLQAAIEREEPSSQLLRGLLAAKSRTARAIFRLVEEGRD